MIASSTGLLFSVMRIPSLDLRMRSKKGSFVRIVKLLFESPVPRVNKRESLSFSEIASVSGPISCIPFFRFAKYGSLSASTAIPHCHDFGVRDRVSYASRLSPPSIFTLNAPLGLQICSSFALLKETFFWSPSNSAMAPKPPILIAVLGRSISSESKFLMYTDIRQVPSQAS